MYPYGTYFFRFAICACIPTPWFVHYGMKLHYYTIFGHTPPRLLIILQDPVKVPVLAVLRNSLPIWVDFCATRMHSSRMRTVRSSSHPRGSPLGAGTPPGADPPDQAPPPGSRPPRPGTPLDQVPPRSRHPPEQPQPSTPGPGTPPWADTRL